MGGSNIKWEGITPGLERQLLPHAGTERNGDACRSPRGRGNMRVFWPGGRGPSLILPWGGQERGTGNDNENNHSSVDPSRRLHMGASLESLGCLPLHPFHQSSL